MVKKKANRTGHPPRHGRSHRLHPSADSASRFRRAVDLHEQGKLDLAEALYQEILQEQPRHFDALLFLGHLYLHSGRPEKAVATTRKAIEENRQHPVAHFNLGLALMKLGQHETAVASFDRAVELMPEYSEAHCNRGIALQNLGHHQEAIAGFERAIECMPENWIAYNNRGISLQQLRQHAEAIASFDRALELHPGNAVAHNNRGISLLAIRKHGDALACFERALELLPDYAEAYGNRGLALQHAGRDEEALASFDRALELSPDSGTVHGNRGKSLLRIGRLDEAFASLDRALGANPDSAEVLNYRGLALQDVGRFQEALHCFDQALELQQAHPGALTNRGNVLRNLNRNAEALDSYDAALLRESSDASTHLNASLCRLLLGDFARGWEEFEWRWQTAQYRDVKPNFVQPLWLGTDALQGTTILLHSEQGLGDTIQFCRYARLVAAQGAQVLLQVQPVLKPALIALEGVSQVLARGEPLPPFDCHCPLMSLPLAFNTDLGSIPARPRYLDCDAAQLARWAARCGDATRPRIGLAWSGNADFANDRNRSIALEVLVKLVSEQAQFFSLQREVRPADQLVLDAHKQIVHFGDELHDFSDTAALAENMDLVISVDTAVAHLAGALGKPVWILLPLNADWRWLLNRADSPWYPSARLFRQSRLGDWGEVIDRLSRELGVLQGSPAV